MTRSMTGFGRSEIKTDDYKVVCEIKSVNHRYLDLSCKMPARIGYLENNVRSLIKDDIKRGKVDVYISYEESKDDSYEITYHPEIAAAYVSGLKKMAEEFGLEYDIRVSTLSRYPDVFTAEEVPSEIEKIWERVSPCVKNALSDFVKSRETEGEKLKADLLSKLDEMTGYVKILEERSPVILEEYKGRLLEKVHDLMENNAIDENRIAAEITLYADKICIDEEMVRLKSHITEMQRMFGEEDELGRKMDFIAQELNREANTILSKSTDVQLADVGINLKTLIEKIREQIQNLE
ncbi:MAG: YicC family protein [Lachnospiraceae bacterium]|nr:YicC family protein [Lachnospiraceae bacterium]